MVRKISNGENQFFHPLLSLSMFIACMAATIVMVSSLCGFLSRKKRRPPPGVAEGKNDDVDNVAVAATKEESEIGEIENSSELNKSTRPAEDSTEASTNDVEQVDGSEKLPPPPGVFHLKGVGSTSHNPRSNSSAMGNLGKMVSSRSMRMLGNTMSFKQLREKKIIKHEDSIWKKRIILGEKCRVPDDDEDDNVIIYDGKGDRISAYRHRKAQSSISVSRQTSFMDPETIPQQEQQRET